MVLVRPALSARRERLFRQAGDDGGRREDAMQSLEPTRKLPLQAEAVELAWSETIAPRCVAANEAPPPLRAAEDGDRRFLTALLRALSVWCA